MAGDQPMQGFMERGESADVGIFSRSGESDYRWLLSILREEFRVCTFLISNNNRFQFLQEVRKCRFAILYHTKNRGRVNITNVTDSLYDEEIDVLFRELGKDQVIVVVDDLDDSSDDAKRRIMESQFSLRDLTRGIFLYTREEKVDREVLRRKVQIIKNLIPKDTVSSAIYIPGISSSSGRRRSKLGILPLAMVSVPSLCVWWDTYLTPERRLLMLSGLWVAVFGRTLCCTPTTPLLPIPSWGRFILSCTVTVVIAYSAYRKPSRANVTLSVLWVTASSRHLLCRRYRKRAGVAAWQMMAYGLALFTFWKAWQSPDTTKVSEQMCRALLLSPFILASE